MVTDGAEQERPAEVDGPGWSARGSAVVALVSLALGAAWTVAWDSDGAEIFAAGITMLAIGGMGAWITRHHGGTRARTAFTAPTAQRGLQAGESPLKRLSEIDRNGDLAAMSRHLNRSVRQVARLLADPPSAVAPPPPTDAPVRLALVKAPPPGQGDPAADLAQALTGLERQGVVVGSVAHEGVRLTADINDMVAGLNETVHDIAEVVDLLGEFGERASAASLSAMIEVARTRANGKGLAVAVAEARTLAAQVVESTDQMAVKIRRVEGAAGRAVTFISDVARSVERMADIITEVGARAERQLPGQRPVSAGSSVSSAAAERLGRLWRRLRRR